MSLDDFLAGKAAEHAGTKFSDKCSICTNEKLAEEVAEWVRKKHNGEVAHSVNWIWQHYFQPTHSVGAVGTLRQHIRSHLGVLDI